MFERVLRYPARPVRSVVHAGRGALSTLGSRVRRVTTARRAILLTDPHVDALHGDAARRALRRAGFTIDTVRAPRGERAKQPEPLARVWRAFAAVGLGRDDVVVALGGGVIGDLAGFAAATWMRGVAWYGVPTTVVAQVDSSIGGKTGIDLPSGKNLVGAFHHPVGVLVDPELLATLPAREFHAGLAEVAKVGFATDAALFRMLERDAAPIAAREPDATFRAVRAALAAKMRVVQADERERAGGPRTALNFGHTVGHALESAAGFRGLRHGEAVAIGMRFAAALSVRFAGLAPETRARLETLLDHWRLPRRIPGLSVDAIERALRLDKKGTASRTRWVLTPRLGHASVPRLISTRVVRTALLEAGATV